MALPADAGIGSGIARSLILADAGADRLVGLVLARWPSPRVHSSVFAPMLMLMLIFVATVPGPRCGCIRSACSPGTPHRRRAAGPDPEHDMTT
ncbi:MAG: hypothetical protein ABW163_06555 [Luteimonas sp.]